MNVSKKMDDATLTLSAQIPREATLVLVKVGTQAMVLNVLTLMNALTRTEAAMLMPGAQIQSVEDSAHVKQDSKEMESAVNLTPMHALDQTMEDVTIMLNVPLQQLVSSVSVKTGSLVMDLTAVM